jgi:hypothetical protein
VPLPRQAAKTRILDTNILNHYTPGKEFSEPIYLGPIVAVQIRMEGRGGL